MTKRRTSSILCVCYNEGVGGSQPFETSPKPGDGPGPRRSSFPDGQAEVSTKASNPKRAPGNPIGEARVKLRMGLRSH